MTMTYREQYEAWLRDFADDTATVDTTDAAVMESLTADDLRDLLS